jgi:uncharacterized protein YfiM (DUF2279 family)
MHKVISLAVLLFAAPCMADANETNVVPQASNAVSADIDSSSIDANSWSKETKFKLAVTGSMAFVTGWGFAKWDYGSRSPHARNEGWFGAATKEGGADKFGHLHLSFALANGLPALYESWGFDADSAAKRGLWSSLLIMNYMEFGDSFSDYGFAYEDLLMNVAGATAGYWLRQHPRWDERLAIRVEYVPDSLNVDFFTDYERTKYLVALRGDTLIPHRYGKWFDLQVGYLARGYTTQLDPHREWFVGIGINLRTGAEHFGMRKTGYAFRYWQPPGTSLKHRFAIH